MAFDYGYQIKTLAMGLRLAEDLYNEWNVPTSEHPKTIDFGTLTSSESLPKEFWDRNMREFVYDFMLGSLNASGLWSLEMHQSGALHAHYISVYSMEFKEPMRVALELWKANIGIYQVDTARNLPRAVAYVTKSVAELGNDVPRELIDGIQFFGNAWTKEAIDSVSLPDFGGIENGV